jgi:hypothetical protein
MNPDVTRYWTFLPLGFLLTIAVELPIVFLGLSRRHGIGVRLAAGVWLTACTYPIVVLVLPLLVEEPYGRPAYLMVAETFAPLAECALFYLAFGGGEGCTLWSTARDFATIVIANLASFGAGLLLFSPGCLVAG